ncbi:DUF86 domain-containing protein [Gloeocapsopsis dulcis]|uniref:HepT-like ribonuclease domain-containing protein n=1 Tax=Gloeocapsopsis dulcis TaxID=2859516 RepID=UPI0018C68578|nr:HepT-like ribonuclease domain-containing protein [Gloeocapsopsis dulcis]WNN89255.1 DUF86 domain-containing protein [Gloeocapsopsis dulcis]
MSRDKATLLDLAKASRLILQFTQGIDKATFETDLKTHSSVCYHAILGEAVKRLSQEFREQNSDIVWTSIAGMRDKVFTIMTVLILKDFGLQ